MSPESSVSILKSLASLEVLLCISRIQSGLQGGHAWLPTVVNGIFYVRNAVCMSHESSVSILRSLASLEVPRLLGVSRVSSKESKRTCLVPDCSQWCISCQECNMHVPRILCVRFQVSSFLGSL